jgi:hypothetical protein
VIGGAMGPRGTRRVNRRIDNRPATATVSDTPPRILSRQN